jgi:hypothetical protein
MRRLIRSLVCIAAVCAISLSTAWADPPLDCDADGGDFAWAAFWTCWITGVGNDCTRCRSCYSDCLDACLNHALYCQGEGDPWPGFNECLTMCAYEWGSCEAQYCNQPG